MISFLKPFAIGVLTLCAFVYAAGQTVSSEAAGKFLPNQLGDFRSAGAPATLKTDVIPANLPHVASAATRVYAAKNGQRSSVTLITTASTSSAYALLTTLRRTSADVARLDLGTEAFQSSDKLVFVKGPVLVLIHPEIASQGKPSSLELGKSLAATIAKGEGDIPVLIKHLPGWETVRENVFYALDKNELRKALGEQPIIDALSFDGGAEAAVADYNGAKMALIEFNTPQIASDNDQRINSRLQELESQSQPSPTAYRRVGNYAVFVFNAQNQDAANQLIDQVKYQQLVQWLGENPYRYDEAVREFSETTLGVFVNVVKASGLALMATFGVGGLLGGLLFTRRRAQQRAQEAYSDAGGMLRLNLDEITPRTDRRRLLGTGLENRTP